MYPDEGEQWVEYPGEGEQWVEYPREGGAVGRFSRGRGDSRQSLGEQ